MNDLERGGVGFCKAKIWTPYERNTRGQWLSTRRGQDRFYRATKDTPKQLNLLDSCTATLLCLGQIWQQDLMKAWSTCDISPWKCRIFFPCLPEWGSHLVVFYGSKSCAIDSCKTRLQVQDQFCLLCLTHAATCHVLAKFDHKTWRELEVHVR